MLTINKVRLCITFVIFGISCFANNCYARANSLPLIQIGKDASAVIDGHLSEPVWQRCAQALPFVKTNGNGLADVQSQVKVYYDENNLYIGFVCEEPKPERLIVNHRNHDSAIWSDDCIEIFLKRPTAADVYHIVVNSAGVIYDARDADVSWESKARVATSKETNRWLVEMALPWSSIGVTPQKGTTLRVNFCRERKVKGELSAWSCTYGGFHKIERFGYLILGKPIGRVNKLKVSKKLLPGANKAEIGINVFENQKVELFVFGKRIAQFAGSKSELNKTFFFPIGLTGDFIDFELRANNNVFWRTVIPVRIKPPPAFYGLKVSLTKGQQCIKNLSAKSPLRKALQKKVNEAKQVAIKFQKAITKSLKEHKPLSPKNYRQMNSELITYRDVIRKSLWPVWHKNNWLDVKRNELPQRLSDVSVFQYPLLVNEYQSANFLITNLRSSPLYLRIVASDFTAFEPKDNILKNGNFEKDEDKDGVPDGWKKSSKTNVSCIKMLNLPDGRRALLIDYNCPNASREVFLLQNIKLQSGKEYLIQFKAKTVGNPNIRVSVINSGWRDDRGTGWLVGSSGWHIVRKKITAPPGGDSLRFIILSHKANGKVWLSDFQLIPCDKVLTFRDAGPEIRVVDWQNLRGGGRRADPLIPLNSAGRLDIPPHQTRQIWLTFRGRDLPPGLYSTSIELRPLASQANQHPLNKQIDFELEYAPLRLRTSPTFKVYNWDYAENEAQVRNLYEHKVNLFLCGAPFPEYNKDGSIAKPADFSKSDRMLRIKMRYARKANGGIMFTYGIIRSFYHHWEKKFGWKFMGERWKRAFVAGYRSWLEHLKQLGLKHNEFYVQIWDEAMHDRLRYVVEGGKLLRQIDPNVRLVMDGEQPLALAKKMNPYVDVWIPALHCILGNSKESKSLLNWYKHTGKPIWTYTCQIRMKALSAYKYYRLKPWYAASLDLDGVCYWAYNSWYGDPWNDFDGPARYGGDCCVIYPGRNGQPIDSRRWEASREGIEDWQIIRLVKNLAKDIDAQTEVLAEKYTNDAMQAVLSEPNDFNKADEMRKRMIAYATQLARKNPLTITDVKNVKANKALSVSWSTNRLTSGKFFYKLQNSDNWQTISLMLATKHKVKVQLPYDSHIEWIILCWDKLGRLAFIHSQPNSAD